MNDCVWSWIQACDGKCKCDKYISINSEEGYKIERQYNEEITTAIKPVQARWKEYFQNVKNKN